MVSSSPSAIVGINRKKAWSSILDGYMHSPRPLFYFILFCGLSCHSMPHYPPEAFLQLSFLCSDLILICIQNAMFLQPHNNKTDCSLVQHLDGPVIASHQCLVLPMSGHSLAVSLSLSLFFDTAFSGTGAPQGFVRFFTLLIFLCAPYLSSVTLLYGSTSALVGC